MRNIKTVVILGAGFGGVRCALTLEKLVRKAGLPNVRIVLIDKNRYHTFIPSLYEVACAAPSVSEDVLYHRVNILIKHLVLAKQIEFLKAEAASIEVEPHSISFTDGNGIDFDYLVIALGSETNFYDIPGLKEFALDLKDFVSALKIRRAIKLADEVPKKIVIGGGGTTGVELAAELVACFRKVCPEITLVQGDERILPAFPEKVSRLAQNRLRKLGVKLVCGKYIKEVAGRKVYLSDNTSLAYERLFWAGGIAAHPLLSPLPFQKEKDFLKVDECLHPVNEDGSSQGHIWALGDACVTYDRKGEIIPWTAQKAIAEGRKIAENIFVLLGGKSEKVCKPERVRFIIPVGGKWAITKLNSLTFAGFWGWVLKNVVELQYLLSILPWHKAFLKWVAAIVTFGKND